MNLNTGQCLPLSIIAQECIETVQRESLDPGRTLIWMIPSRLSCNFGLFAGYLKTLLEKNGLSDLQVYAGRLSNLDISPVASMDTYLRFPVETGLNVIRPKLRDGCSSRHTPCAVRQPRHAACACYLGNAEVILQSPLSGCLQNA